MGVRWGGGGRDNQNEMKKRGEKRKGKEKQWMKKERGKMIE